MQSENNEKIPFIVSVWSGNGSARVNFCGTGVLLNSTTVLTCRHVVTKALELANGGRHDVWICCPSTESAEFKADSCGLDELRDIAYIKLQSEYTNLDQGAYPAILTEVTGDSWSNLKALMSSRNCRVQGFSGSDGGQTQNHCLITDANMSGEVWKTEYNSLLDVKCTHTGIPSGMSGSPMLIQNHDKTWYLLGMACLGGLQATDSAILSTLEISRFLTAKSVEYRALSVTDFLKNPKEIEKKQAAAKARLKSEIARILDEDATLRGDLLICIQNKGHSVANSTSSILAKCIIELLSVDHFVIICGALARQYQSARKTASSELLTRLYWTTLAATIDPECVNECQRVLFSAASVGGVVLIPSSDRTILELIMAGVDGRAAKWQVPNDGQLPCSKNELNIDDIPENGADPSQYQCEIDQILCERLGIRDWMDKRPKVRRQKIRSFLEYRVEADDRVFAVFRRWSQETQADVDKTDLKELLQSELPGLVWVDTIGSDPDADCPEIYDYVLNPLHDRLLLPWQ